MATSWTSRTQPTTTWNTRSQIVSPSGLLLINSIDNLLINATDQLIISISSSGTLWNTRIIP